MNVFDQVAKAFAARRKAAQASGDGEVRLAVMVGDCASAEMAAALRDALCPETAEARLSVVGYGAHDALPAVNALSDAAVVLAQPGDTLGAELVRSYRAAGVACCMVVEDCGDGCYEPNDLVADVLACAPESLADMLGGWLVATLPELAVALGEAFACCRRARARTLALEAARNNALVGSLAFLKDADMPVMMATEIAMMYKMAGTYGLPLDAARLKEVAAVVVSSFALRGTARAAVRLLPLPTFLVKAAVAGVGTYALGQGLMAYYDALATPASPVEAEMVAVEPVVEGTVI